MEDFKGLIWVLLAVGAFIWQLVQKIKQQAEEARRKEEKRAARQNFGTPKPLPAPPVPSLSFEELLAQMQRQNREEERLPEQPAPEKRVSEERVPEERPLLEPRGRFARSQEKTEVELHSQELPAPEARSLEAPKRAPRRADTMPRTSTQPGQEDYWSRAKSATPEQTRHTVSDLLRNPADLRAAFVLSEILGRKW